MSKTRKSIQPHASCLVVRGKPHMTPDLGLRFEGVSFVVKGFGLRFQKLGLMVVGVLGLGCRVRGLEIRV